MADDVLVLEARLKNLISGELSKIRGDFKKFEDNTDKTLKNVSKQSKNTSKSLFRMGNIMKVLTAGAVIKLGKAFFEAGAEMETLNTQFKVLLGSTEAAKDRMQELSKFAQTTPFQLKDVAAASRVLETLTKGTMSTGKGLRIVGDAAASVGADFQNLAIHVGRAYSGLQSNRPVGESLMRLQELGLVTGETRNKIEDLTKQAKGKQAWEILQKELSKTEGGMKALSKTVPGLSSTIKDQLQGAMRQMLDSGVWDQIRLGMAKVTDILNEMIDKNLFGQIAMGITSFVKMVGSSVMLVFNMVQTGIQQIIEFVTVAITGWLGVVKTIIAKLPDRLIPDEWETSIENAFQTFNNFAMAAKNTGDDFASSAVENFNSVAKSAGNFRNAVKGNLPEPTGSFTAETGGTGKVNTGGGGLTPEQIKTRNEQILEARRALTDASIALIQEDNEREFALLEEKHRRELEAIAGNNEAVATLKMAHDLEMEEFENKLAEKKLERDEKLKNKQMNNVRNQTSFAINATKDMFKAMGGEQKKYRAALKAAAIVEATINTFLAASKANTATPYPPVNAGLMALAIGQGIAQVAMISKQKFQTGGIVDGPRTPVDAIPIEATGGEMMLTGADQRNLLNTIRGNNTGGGESPISLNLTFQGPVDQNTLPDIQRSVEELGNTFKMAVQSGVIDFNEYPELVTTSTSDDF